jgi:hypothetical protein
MRHLPYRKNSDHRFKIDDVFHPAWKCSVPLTLALRGPPSGSSYKMAIPPSITTMYMKPFQNQARPASSEEGDSQPLCPTMTMMTMQIPPTMQAPPKRLPNLAPTTMTKGCLPLRKTNPTLPPASTKTTMIPISEFTFAKRGQGSSRRSSCILLVGIKMATAQ